MYLNITLIIQAIHFFFAFFILRIFLLKPALAYINKEKQLENTVHQAIDALKRKLDTRFHEKNTAWQLHQDFIRNNMPCIFKRELALFRFNIPPSVHVDLSIPEYENLIKNIKSRMIEKVMQ